VSPGRDRADALALRPTTGPEVVDEGTEGIRGQAVSKWDTAMPVIHG
jgi:hypothetical protein